MAYFESTPEDQIAVSFICNQYLYIYRICMRPHVLVNLEPYATEAGAYDEDEGGDSFRRGSSQFNEFHLEISGFNEGDSSSEYERVSV